MASTIVLKVRRPASTGAKRTVKAPPKAASVGNVTVEAGDSLLRAIKAKMLRERGKVDVAKLRRNGYTDAVINHLKAL
jgi:hypothetical protein